MLLLLFFSLTTLEGWAAVLDISVYKIFSCSRGFCVFFILTYLCMHVCVHVCMCVGICWGQRTIYRSRFSLSVVSEDQRQVFRMDRKRLYSLWWLAFFNMIHSRITMERIAKRDWLDWVGLLACQCWHVLIVGGSE